MQDDVASVPLTVPIAVHPVVPSRKTVKVDCAILDRQNL